MSTPSFPSVMRAAALSVPASVIGNVMLYFAGGSMGADWKTPLVPDVTTRTRLYGALRRPAHAPLRRREPAGHPAHPRRPPATR